MPAMLLICGRFQFFTANVCGKKSVRISANQNLQSAICGSANFNLNDCNLYAKTFHFAKKWFSIYWNRLDRQPLPVLSPNQMRYNIDFAQHFETDQWSSGKSVCYWKGRLGFDSRSRQTNDFKTWDLVSLLERLALKETVWSLHRLC